MAPAPNAFTLIELILVMTVLLTVTALAAPQLAQFFRGRTLDAEARRFLALTRHGQSRAVSEGVPMVLWLDAAQRAYGLEVQPGYVEYDPQADAFALGRDLEIEAELPPAAVVGSVGFQAAAVQQSLARWFGNLPAIVFTPEGFVTPTSPQAVLIREGERDAVWIALSRNRLNYEIRTEPR